MSRTSATPDSSAPDAAPAVDGPADGPDPGSGGRPWTSRLSAGHGLMLLAGLVAAVANFAYLRSQSDQLEVLVAAGDLRPGQVITAEQVERRTVQASGRLADALVRPGELDGREVVAAAPLPAGTALRDADLQPVAAGGGNRRMSIPVEPARAAGGRIAPGDRVDVIHVVDGRAGYVVAGAPVLAVERVGGAAGLAGTGSLSLTVAVGAEAALCLARAIESGALDVVVSTGQEPVAPGGCTPGRSTPGRSTPGTSTPGMTDPGTAQASVPESGEVGS